MLKLNNRVAIVKKKKRIGRGGSRGGTSGRGHKGQKARSGAGRKIGPAFEGGQMPLHRRLPKRGFNNTRFRVESAIITLDQLEKHFDAESKVTKELLFEKGLLKKVRVAVKVLNTGEITKKLDVTVDGCSASAIEAITACGGVVNLIKGA
jgi:large subunit ribosomal protein L15